MAAALGRLLDMNEMEQLMQQIDTNGDGWVTFDEFYRWYSDVGQYAD